VIDLPGGSDKRLACSYNFHDTGVSTFVSPVLSKGEEKTYKYYDPLNSVQTQFVVDLSGGGSKRLACSYESFDREKGIPRSPVLTKKGEVNFTCIMTRCIVF
jgi:hypothetical protein